ncbi:MAG: hypothetical protein AB7R00_13810 [Kofleriaceae bacterium]
MRWPLLLSSVIACGDNRQVAAPDAGTPDAAELPDAPACTADVSTDEANCGACDHLCNGGEVCKSGTCNCPGGVVPPLVFPTGFEQFLGAAGFTVALAPTISLGGVNGLAFGYDTNVPLDTDIELSDVPLGSLPFVGAAAGVDLQSLAIDASYLATSGTIRFTKHCETEIEGTLTNATFQGISGGLLGGGIPMIDPEGCVIEVDSLSFHLATEACP